MNRNLVGVGIVAAALAVLAGCSDGRSDRTADIGVGGEAASSYSTPSEMAPSAPFGTTQQIRSDGFAVGVSDYTVANPRREGDAFVVDLTIATKQGECILDRSSC
ncbi:hypothetical protein GS449_14035 [Rhodococcus hoagii]|nr:hypothetical protein [Prescottella equi]